MLCHGSLQWSLLLICMAWISTYIHYKVWDEIAYSFPNINDCTVEDCKLISNFIPHIPGQCDYLSMLGLKFSHVCKRDHSCLSRILCPPSTLQTTNNGRFSIKLDVAVNVVMLHLNWRGSSRLLICWNELFYYENQMKCPLIVKKTRQ